ncbi:MAG: FAD-dependent oxidoreductase [Desulfitobacterium hafniense]|nr:FAD-dependent oxidoreductase [Desulfitobacterium hafniense]
MAIPSIREPERYTPIIAETDVLVVGGGAAGFAAALAASRQGASTILIERDSFFGGTLTAATLGSFCGLFTVTENEVIPVVKGIASELVERLRASGYATETKRWLKTASVPFDATGLKFVLDDMVVESGVKPILGMMVVGTVMEGDRIQGVIIEGKGGRGFIACQVVIDATGDGDVAAQAGLPLEMNAEDLQFASAMFRFHDVDTDIIKSMTRDKLQQYLTEAADSGKYQLPRLSGGVHLTPKPGTAHCNVTKVSLDGRPVNPLNPLDLSRGEIIGRQQIREYERFFRDRVPGFDRAYVSDVGSRLGIRESRRLKGDYVLTVEDVLGCRRFPDAIACSAWPVEIHGEGKETKWVWIEPGNYYHIPYRSLISSQCSNLLVAGRCISSTHEAQASVRVVGVCLAIGQAAGIAAAIVARDGTNVSEIDITKLQGSLTESGAYLG